MSLVTLLPQTGSISVGPSFNVGTLTSKLNLQFTPQANLGFSGNVVIETSTAPNPGANDWFTIATVACSAHTTTVSFNLYISNNPWIRARLASATIGKVSVYMAF